MHPFWGAGDLTQSPASLADALSHTPSTLLLAGTLGGVPAITAWALATPLLYARLTAGSRRAASLSAAAFVLFVPFAALFHVLTGLWGVLGDSLDPGRVEALWQGLSAILGVLLVTHTLALWVAVARGRGLPRWAPLVSPGVLCTVPAMVAQMIPAPLGAPIAITASTMGMTVWLCLLLAMTASDTGGQQPAP